MFHLIHYKLSLFLPKKYSHLGHTEEDDLVSKHILIIKVGSFGYLCSLEAQNHNYTFFLYPSLKKTMGTIPSYWRTTQPSDYSSSFLCKGFEPVIQRLSYFFMVKHVFI